MMEKARVWGQVQGHEGEEDNHPKDELAEPSDDEV